MLGGITKKVSKTIKKTRDSILKDLAVKQKVQLDEKISEISPKTLQQVVKYYKTEGRSIGGKSGFQGSGLSIGRYNFR